MRSSTRPHVPWAIWSSLFAAALLLVSGVLVRARLAAAQGGLVPDAGFTLRNVLELLVEMLRGLAEQNMGPHWRKYFPIIGTIFFFILISNLIGPDPRPRGRHEQRRHHLGLGHHLLRRAPVRRHQGARLRLREPLPRARGSAKYHIPLLAPLYAPIELISHLSRVFTLAVRLLANMFADHIVVGVWLALVPAVVPAVFMGLGVMVAFLQAYVFAMLSMIYIGLALEDAH